MQYSLRALSRTNTFNQTHSLASPLVKHYHIKNKTFRRLNLSYLVFQTCTFEHCSFIDCTFEGSVFYNVYFKNCFFKNCKCKKIYTRFTIIQDNVIEKCDFHKSTHVDLYKKGNIIENSNLDKINIYQIVRGIEYEVYL